MLSLTLIAAGNLCLEMQYLKRGQDYKMAYVKEFSQRNESVRSLLFDIRPILFPGSGQ